MTRERWWFRPNMVPAMVVVAAVSGVLLPGGARLSGARLIGAARAQGAMAGMAAAPSTAAGKNEAPWAAANEAAMMRMDHAMADPGPVGDEDHAFVAGMMPHHQGAIDMARVELRYGHDKRLRALARDIVAAQERELGTMRAWLEAHPATP